MRIMKLGVVRESKGVMRSSNLGAPLLLHAQESGVAQAYPDAARRLVGENVPVSVPPDTRSLLARLLGRRPA